MENNASSPISGPSSPRESLESLSKILAVKDGAALLKKADTIEPANVRPIPDAGVDKDVLLSAREIHARLVSVSKN